MTHLTKCWKINLRIAKFAGGNLLSKPRRAINLQLLSALTSIFILFDMALRDPAISSSSAISSGSNKGGSRFEKKSFNAVATAFTGISSLSISVSSPE